MEISLFKSSLYGHYYNQVKITKLPFEAPGQKTGSLLSTHDKSSKVVEPVKVPARDVKKAASPQSPSPARTRNSSIHNSSPIHWQHHHKIKTDAASSTDTGGPAEGHAGPSRHRTPAPTAPDPTARHQIRLVDGPETIKTQALQSAQFRPAFAHDRSRRSSEASRKHNAVSHRCLGHKEGHDEHVHQEGTGALHGAPA